MTFVIRPAPVRKSIFVSVSPEEAFDVFTSGIGRWWPKSHKIGQAAPDRPVIEAYPGGRWYELGVDGSQCDIGKVLAFEPPTRLLLAWQLGHDFVFNPELVTEVEITFTREQAGTRVDLEHRKLERLGDHAAALRQQVDSPNGWEMLLELYRETAIL